MNYISTVWQNTLRFWSLHSTSTVWCEEKSNREAGSAVLPEQVGPMESRADMLNEGGKISEAPSLTSFSAPPLAGVAPPLTNVRGIPLQQRVDFTKKLVKIGTWKLKMPVHPIPLPQKSKRDGGEEGEIFWSYIYGRSGFNCRGAEPVNCSLVRLTEPRSTVCHWTTVTFDIGKNRTDSGNEA